MLAALTWCRANIRVIVCLLVVPDVVRCRRKGRRSSSVMEGGQEILKRKSMGCRFKGELKALVERIHSTEVSHPAQAAR